MVVLWEIIIVLFELNHCAGRRIWIALTLTPGDAGARVKSLCTHSGNVLTVTTRADFSPIVPINRRQIIMLTMLQAGGEVLACHRLQQA